MRRALEIAAAAALAVVSGLSVGTRDASAKGSQRLSWVGLVRGPLAPKSAEQLEGLILDELDGYESFRLVDASGDALDDRLLAAEAARAAKLLDEGVDHLLNFRHKKAVQKFEQAVEVFETRLTPLRDHEILHEALLAKAEALYQGGKSTAAMETLKSLAALSPKKVPSKKTHAQKFVSLYDRALEELEMAGRLEIEAEGPDCTIIFDGKPMGTAPVSIPRVTPGKHYIVARWPFDSVLQAVQVAPGRDVRVRVVREGPGAQARTALLEVIDGRQGTESVATIAKRITDLSSSDDALVAAVKSDNGANVLLVARHNAEGRTDAVVRVPLPDSIDSDAMSTAVRRIGVALFVDKRGGEFELAADGEARPVAGLEQALYGRGFGGGVTVQVEPVDATPAAIAAVPPADPPPGSPGLTNGGSLTTTVDPEEEDPPITKRWWFWVGIGAAFVGAAVVGGVIVLQPDPNSTVVDLTVPR